MRQLSLCTAAAVLALLWPADAAAQSVDELIELVSEKPSGMDPDEWKEKRRDAARELGVLGDKKAVPALIEVVETEEFDIVAEYAIEALGRLGDARAAPALEKVANDKSRDSETRKAAKAALRKIKRGGDGGGGGGGGDGGGGDGGGGGSDGGGGGGSDGGGGTEPSSSNKSISAGPGADLIAASERLTFALGSARLQYDTVRESPSIDGDIAATYQRESQRERSLYRYGGTADVVAGVINFPGDDSQGRTVVFRLGGSGEAHFFLEGNPIFGRVAGGLTLSTTYTKIDRPDIDDDTSVTLLGADIFAAIGVGYGRIFNQGEALRVKRIERALKRARALGRPITPDLAAKLMRAWWELRGRVGAHDHLTRTVELLREAGVLLGEPTASVSYQILQILLDGQLGVRPHGISAHLSVGESYLLRDDDQGLADGRVESAIAAVSYGRQSEDGVNELVMSGTARYRLLAPDGEATPLAATATGAWRRYVYNDTEDPIGALEITGEVGASDDGFDGSDLATRLGAGIGWLFVQSRATQFRVAATVRVESEEIFVGAEFAASFGLLDVSYVGAPASMWK